MNQIPVRCRLSSLVETQCTTHDNHYTFHLPPANDCSDIAIETVQFDQRMLHDTGIGLAGLSTGYELPGLAIQNNKSGSFVKQTRDIYFDVAQYFVEGEKSLNKRIATEIMQNKINKVDVDRVKEAMIRQL